MRRFELLDRLTGEEAELLEEVLEKTAHPEREAGTKHQAAMVFSRIRRDRKRVRRLLPAWVAVAVLVFGTLSYAASENDWDLRLAQYLGLDEAVEYLDGGAIRLEASDTCGGITVSAVQAIGDKNSQWIWIDTGLPWEFADGNGYYMFDEYSFQVLDRDGIPLSGGSWFYSFENEGRVSFLLYAQGFEEINRRQITLKLGELCAYEEQPGEEKKRTVISGESWALTWQNAYPANVKTAYPMKTVVQRMDDGTEVSCLIYKVEISPVSVYIKGIMNPFKKGERNQYAHLVMEIDAVSLKDGTVIELGGYNSSGSNSSGWVDCFLSLQEYGSILDVEQVESVTIGGKELRIR